MLKINPEKDIKELEKFGFEKQTRKEKTHKYEFEKGRLYSMTDFDCENRGRVKQIHLKIERSK